MSKQKLAINLSLKQIKPLRKLKHLEHRDLLHL